MTDGEERARREVDEADVRGSDREPAAGGETRPARSAGERPSGPAEPHGEEGADPTRSSDEGVRSDESWADRPVAIPLPGPRADEEDEGDLPDRPLRQPEPEPRRPIPLPPPLERPAPVETRRTPQPERAPGEQIAETPSEPVPAPPAAAPEPAETPRPEPPEPPGPAAPPRPEPPPEPFDASSLAAASVARAEDEELRRSYREIVAAVERYVADGYDPIVLVGYPQTGKTHGLKALSYVLRGFEEEAREELQRDLAPGYTEAWPFYRPVASPEGARWVFVDIGGELYARLRDNDWTLADAAAGLLHTVSRCRGLLLMVHLERGHLDLGPSGLDRGMSDAESQAEREVQRAHEELGFLDQFLLFVRALHRERGDVERFFRKVADAPSLDAALREYRGVPRLEVPVAVLFTQADRLAEGGDFAVGGGDHLAPQSLVRVAPFVARHLPGLFASLLRHARRFKLDFVQSYVERPAPGGERPVWFHGREPLSVGLLPAVEFLERNLPPRDGRRPLWERGIDTRTALRIHRLLHPGLWRGVEVDL